MADTPAPQAAAAPQGPMVHVQAQYTKNLSFENPNAPGSLRPREGAGPNINIQVNVNSKHVADADFEVDITIEGDARIEAEVLFAFELTYGGLFRLTNVPAEQMQAVVMIECPRLIFPFARQIISDSVRNGGFPPLYIDPIDFVGLFNQMIAQQQQAAGAAPVAS